MENNSPLQSRGLWVAAVILLLVTGYFVTVWISTPPQLPVQNEAVMNTVDALFTAVSTRDFKLLADCRERLSKFAQSGELPAQSAQRLTQLMDQAEQGDWEPAGRQLYDFMLGQKGQRN